MGEAVLPAEIEVALTACDPQRMPPRLRALYEDRLGADRRRRLSAILFMLAALESVGVLSWVEQPDAFLQVWAPRSVVAALALLAGIAIRQAKPGWREELAFIAGTMPPLILVSAVSAAAPSAYADRSTILPVLFLACLCALTPLSMPASRRFGLAGYGCYAATLLLLSGHLTGRGVAALLVFGAAAIGLSLVAARRREQSRCRAFLRTLREEANSAELARLNGELQRLMHTDVLTGVANRRRFESDLQAAWARAESQGWAGGIGLLLVDVDHFKAFNDCAGHAEGDHCLCDIAMAIADMTRGGTLAMARWGGEEFVVLAPGILRGAIDGLGERVRRAVEARAIPHPAMPGCVVTASVGAAWCGAELPCGSADALLRQADNALYVAKRAGRNRVGCAPQNGRVIPLERR